MKTHHVGLAAALLALSAGCGSDGDLDTFCKAFDVLNQDEQDIITAEQGLEQVDILAESAPEEIRADAQTARDGYHAVTEAVEGAGLPLTTLDNPSTLTAEEQARFSTALSEADYDPQELDDAFESIEAWAGDNC